MLFPEAPDLPGSAALLLLRLVGGAALVIHGYGKMKTPLTWMGDDTWAPGFLQAIAAFSEFGGGIAWLLGLLTVPASVLFLGTMVVAVSTHLSRGEPFVGPGGAASELAALYLAVATVFIAMGPGRFAVDFVITHHRANVGPSPTRRSHESRQEGNDRSHRYA